MIVVDRKRELKDYKQANSTANDKLNNKKLKTSQRKNNIAYMLAYALLIGVMVIFGILYINKYVELNQTATEINQLQREIEILQDRKRNLQLQVSQSKSLERIETLAKEELGMVEPEQVKYLRFNQKSIATQLDSELDEQQKSIIDFNSWADRISAWLQNLTQLRAGTLDN